MTSNTTTARAGEAEDLLFDSWFDPIEDGLRAKVRGFIETMIEEELTNALSRPRYARHPDGAGGAGVMGHRHGHDSALESRPKLRCPAHVVRSRSGRFETARVLR